MSKRKVRPRPASRAARAPVAVSQGPTLSKLLGSRKGKIPSGIVAMSTAAIVAVYALGRSNTSAVGQFADAASNSAPGAPAVGAAGGAASTQLATAGLKDGTFTGSGNSRHGGMNVAVVIQGGKMISANVTSCSTRYPCSDVNALVRAAVAKQGVPASHVSGATDSSSAYRQALTNAIQQASQ